MSDAKPPRKKLTGGAKAVIAMGVVSTLATIFVSVMTLLPTSLKMLSTAYPPIEDRSARKPGGGGCALSEVGAPGACVKASVASVREEEVSFASSIPEKGLATLRGTLSIPVGVEGRRGAVILMHGSGPNDRNEKVAGDLVSRVNPPLEVFAALANFFAHQGLVVLRYDKRACLHCYPDFDRAKLRAFRWHDYEVDARDALAFLATRAEVDPDALVVVGHSEGGQLAPYVAHDDAHVAAVIMLAAPIEDFEGGLLRQIDRLADARLAQWDPLGAWSNRQAKEKYASCFDKLRNDYAPDEICLGGGVTQAALKEFLAYEADMPRMLAEGTCPVMAIQGSVDRNIDPLAIPQIGKALGTRDHELHYIPGVSHDLVDVISPTKPPTVSADLERRLATFLASVKPH